tara:strand:- start:36782 stop:37729 length:948 start_codon:yes stop_codon:yes gene_type:complete
METTNLQFFRTDISPYQAPNFKELEINRLSKLSITPANKLTDADILITNTHTRFELLTADSIKNVKLIIHPNSGYDNIPSSFVRGYNFPIIVGNPVRAAGVTEYILSCVFKHYCQILERKSWDSSRSWKRQRLADQNVLVIGRGLIGNKLIECLSPLVNSLSCYDPFKGLEELVPENKNIVLIAASLNQTSHHLVNKELLSRLPKDSVIVNAARGKIINQEDLKDYLRENKSAHAYLDVFENEPFKVNEFSEFENLHCSSHIAGVSNNLDQLILDFEYKVLNDFLTHRSSVDKFLDTYSSLSLKNKLSPDKSFLI